MQGAVDAAKIHVDNQDILRLELRADMLLFHRSSRGLVEIQTAEMEAFWEWHKARALLKGAEDDVDSEEEAAEEAVVDAVAVIEVQTREAVAK